jgi:hypothetical protein
MGRGVQTYRHVCHQYITALQKKELVDRPRVNRNSLFIMQISKERPKRKMKSNQVLYYNMDFSKYAREQATLVIPLASRARAAASVVRARAAGGPRARAAAVRRTRGIAGHLVRVAAGLPSSRHAGLPRARATVGLLEVAQPPACPRSRSSWLPVRCPSLTASCAPLTFLDT